MSAAAMVDRSFEQYDTDKDDMLSTEEVAAVPEQFRGSMNEADTDGDGKISKAELTVTMAKVVARIRAMQNGGGPPGGNGGPRGGNFGG